jgi:hypothetical protein
MPDMDPRLAALIAKFPDRTPAELYAYLHGANRGDIPLPPSVKPKASIGGLYQMLADRVRSAK